MHHFKMTRQLLIWTFFLSSIIPSLGQDYLGDSRADIINNVRGLVDSSYTLSFSQTVVQINSFYNSNKNDTVLHFDTIATLKVSIDGFEKIELEYFFDTFDNLCDSIVIKYYCSKCVDKHIKDFLANKDRKWKQLGTDNFISRRQTTKSIKKDPTTSQTVTKVGSPQLQIKRTPDKSVCATVYFSVPMMSKDKWEQLTKK